MAIPANILNFELIHLQTIDNPASMPSPASMPHPALMPSPA